MSTPAEQPRGDRMTGLSDVERDNLAGFLQWVRELCEHVEALVAAATLAERERLLVALDGLVGTYAGRDCQHSSVRYNFDHPERGGVCLICCALVDLDLSEADS